MYENLSAYAIYCLDLDAYKSIELQGYHISIMQQTIDFKMDICLDSNRKPGESPCKSSEEIMKFVSNIQIDLY